MPAPRSYLRVARAALTTGLGVFADPQHDERGVARFSSGRLGFRSREDLAGGGRHTPAMSKSVPIPAGQRVWLSIAPQAASKSAVRSRPRAFDERTWETVTTVPLVCFL